jgi:hypothetical protein
MSPVVPEAPGPLAVGPSCDHFAQQRAGVDKSDQNATITMVPDAPNMPLLPTTDNRILEAQERLLEMHARSHKLGWVTRQNKRRAIWGESALEQLDRQIEHAEVDLQRMEEEDDERTTEAETPTTPPSDTRYMSIEHIMKHEMKLGADIMKKYTPAMCGKVVAAEFERRSRSKKRDRNNPDNGELRFNTYTQADVTD